MVGDVKKRERDDENLGYTLPPDYQVRDACMTAHIFFERKRK